MTETRVNDKSTIYHLLIFIYLTKIVAGAKLSTDFDDKQTHETPFLYSKIELKWSKQYEIQSELLFVERYVT